MNLLNFTDFSFETFPKKLSSNPILIKLAVGNEQEASYVNIAGHTVKALPGQNGIFDGGDGYSGGGGYGFGSSDSCDGGTNGENGNCSGGGNGTGEDISTYFFDNFNLNPGAGGINTRFGGGGGGVLINGDGPMVETSRAGVKWSNGEGYGGGGTYHRYGCSVGAPGVIIIEIVEV